MLPATALPPGGLTNCAPRARAGPFRFCYGIARPSLNCFPRLFPLFRSQRKVGNERKIQIKSIAERGPLLSGEKQGKTDRKSRNPIMDFGVAKMRWQILLFRRRRVKILLLFNFFFYFFSFYVGRCQLWIWKSDINCGFYCFFKMAYLLKNIMETARRIIYNTFIKIHRKKSFRLLLPAVLDLSGQCLWITAQNL